VIGTAAARDTGEKPTATRRDYVLATGFTGGTYYRGGLAMATQIDVRMSPRPNFGVVAVPTAGSIQNLKMVLERNADFAIVQRLVLAKLQRKGENLPPASPEPIASIGWLWENVEHFLLRYEYVSQGTLSDLAQVVHDSGYLGSESSGTIVSTKTILEGIGIEVPPEPTSSLSYDSVVEKLESGEFVFASLPGGEPVSAVARVLASLGPKIRLLSVTEEEFGRLVDAAPKWPQGAPPQWRRVNIAAGTYPLQMEDIMSLAQRNVLIARADLPENDVYEITKEIYSNVERLAEVHPALKQLKDAYKDVDSIWPPLHPGARRYFEEILVNGGK